MCFFFDTGLLILMPPMAAVMPSRIALDLFLGTTPKISMVAFRAAPVVSTAPLRNSRGPLFRQPARSESIRWALALSAV